MSLLSKILYLSFLAHFFADFTLQGCLAQMKQKRWWKKAFELYKNEHPDEPFDERKFSDDYIVALNCHGYYWALVTFLPLFFLHNVPAMFVFASIVINAAIHSGIDHYKANELKLNLYTDQFFHLLQVTVTIFLVNVFWPIN